MVWWRSMLKRGILGGYLLCIAAVFCGCRSGSTGEVSREPAVTKGAEDTEETKAPVRTGSTWSQFANDTAVYIAVEGNMQRNGCIIQQWSLDGVLQEAFCVMAETEEREFSRLLFVDQDNVVYSRTNWEKGSGIEEVMQIPILRSGEKQELDVDHQKLLLELDMDMGELCKASGGVLPFFYMNEDYIFYLKDYYSDKGIVVYDRSREKEVSIKNLPRKKKAKLFYQFTDAMPSVKAQVCGDQIIFNSEPMGKKQYRAPYGFSIYRLGEDHIETIDERCYTAAAYITDPERKKVYYQIETDQSIWEYDCKSGKKREMISEQELRSCYDQAGLVWQEGEDDDSLFLQGDCLYLIRAKSDIENTRILSYVLEEDIDSSEEAAGLSYEQRLTDELERWYEIVEWNEGYVEGDLDILEGKLLYSDEETYCCIDLETAESVQVTRGDAECIYFMLIGCRVEGMDVYTEEETERRKRKAVRKEAQRKQEQKARRKTFRQQERKAAELPVEEQLVQLSRKMVQQCRKWEKRGSEEWSEDVYYAVTDLDHNGVLELLLSTGSQGSGGFTTTAIYEAGPQGKAVTVQKPQTGDDITDTIDTAYYDAEKKLWYYITYDYVSFGSGTRGHGDNAWWLKEGETDSENICGYYEDTDHKSKQPKTTYYKVLGEETEELAKAEYDVDHIMEEHFAGCKKYYVTISWGRMRGKRLLSAGQTKVLSELRESYRSFAVK